MLHRAVLGSLERFFGILIENYSGAFPVWLHFEQAAVVPISERFNDYAKTVTESLTAAGIRANAYLSDENMRSKIKFITKEHKTPYILVLGEKEEAGNTVTVRFRQSSGLEQRTFALEDFITYVSKKNISHDTKD